MITVAAVADALEQFAPGALAESWDNVGLLVGDRGAPAERIMTCLTLTGAAVDEALAEGARLVVTHHPLPFRPLKRLTSDTVEGRLLLALIGGGVAVYSPHTAFDSAAQGINAHLAAGLGLTDVEPLVPPAPEPAQGAHRDTAQGDGPVAGSGRAGRLASPETLDRLAARVKDFLGLARLRVAGPSDRTIARVAVACGSGGSFLGAARVAACDALVTGETTFHTCLEAEAHGMGLVLAGHFASERFAVEWLASWLATQFPEAHVWASGEERDPLRTL